jgi:membrane protein implicated in regulation of membrane protease activity
VLWWIWVLLGLALLGLEVLTPGGFYVLFFGAGALVVGSLVGLGYGGPLWAQWLLFSVVSIVTLALFRQRVLRLVDDRKAATAMDTLEGEVAILLDDLAAGTIGKAELRGTIWTAQNVDDRPLGRGTRARVTRVDGLTLKLRAE